MIRTLARKMTLGRWPAIRPGEALTCPEVGRLLQRYLDGELGSDSEIETLEAHLDDCRRCGLEADTYRRITAALAGRRAVVPDESIERLREFGRQLAEASDPT